MWKLVWIIRLKLCDLVIEDSEVPKRWRILPEKLVTKKLTTIFVASFQIELPLISRYLLYDSTHMHCIWYVLCNKRSLFVFRPSGSESAQWVNPQLLTPQMLHHPLNQTANTTQTPKTLTNHLPMTSLWILDRGLLLQQGPMITYQVIKLMIIIFVKPNQQMTKNREQFQLLDTKHLLRLPTMSPLPSKTARPGKIPNTQNHTSRRTKIGGKSFSMGVS